MGPRRVWQDGRIGAGAEWRPEIEQALKKAKVAVFLVGPHFLVSDFIRNDEFVPLLEAAKTEGVRIFPFATHHVPYGRSFLGKFQFYGDPDQPLESQAHHEQNKSMVGLARAIAEVFEF